MSTQAINKADKDLEAAYQTVRQWEDKAREARSQAAQLEADSGREILAGGSAHDIAVKINAADLEAKAYDNASAQARAQLAEARTDLLEAHAADLDTQAAKARRARDEMDERLEALLAQARDLTGEDFEIADRPLELGEVRQTPKYTQAHRAPMFAANAAARVRCFLATGHDARNAYELREHGGFASGLQMWSELVDGDPAVFTRLDELEAQAGLNALEKDAQVPAAQHGNSSPDELYDEDKLDPVEDADIIALTK